jgi:hypothetical protein
MRWAGHIALMGKAEMHTKLEEENLKIRDHQTRPKCSWENNIKMNPGETGCKPVEWIQLAKKGKWSTFLSMVMHFQVLQKHDISCNYQFSKEYHILWNE